jgi:hypothetical protein
MLRPEGGMGDGATSWSEAVRERAAGRSPIVRGLLLSFLAWTWFRLVRNAQAPTWFAGIDLGIHEAGHLLFAGCGRFLMVAGGTILQLAAPLLAGVLLFRRGDDFGACFAAAWFGVNLNEVSVYLSDARAQVLPLVTVGGGEASHDWAYLLDRFGVIQHDSAIGAVLRGCALVLQAAAIAAGALVVYWGARPAPKKKGFLGTLRPPEPRRADCATRPFASPR